MGRLIAIGTVVVVALALAAAFGGGLTAQPVETSQPSAIANNEGQTRARPHFISIGIPQGRAYINLDAIVSVDSDRGLPLGRSRMRLVDGRTYILNAELVDLMDLIGGGHTFTTINVAPGGASATFLLARFRFRPTRACRSAQSRMLWPLPGPRGGPRGHRRRRARRSSPLLVELREVAGEPSVETPQRHAPPGEPAGQPAPDPRARPRPAPRSRLMPSSSWRSGVIQTMKGVD